ncbi:nitroalkane oxidase [Actinocorallia herbida]|uniref:Propionate 3-nitronate monooxygenase n=1 Tax=Actinocorallia herbida TaxID=58109 RepID=A0A3N1CWD6_9ACTN|nr:nitronate monooxygenase [Actinocorallia herbida]ROO85535.1 nitroalkane oxidase [Actinocorallia herbida]
MTGGAQWPSRLRIAQAPMAGGAATPELVAAVCGAGGLGFLAAGYRSAAAMREEIARTRRLTSGAFGVNVFLPTADAADAEAVSAYGAVVEPEARRLGVGLGTPAGGDDDYPAKIEALLADPPAVVGFTFGRPDPEAVRLLRERGVLVLATVTSAEEARQVEGVDALCVQGAEAGGHRGSFANGPLEGVPLDRLLREVRAAVRLPLVAAGGLATGRDVARALAAGADAAMAGTAFLLCPESGTGATHRRALTDPAYDRTAMTRAFTGRPARGLANRFLDAYSALAPAAYPQVHHLTSPLRKAAAAQGDADALHLWAGTSWRGARAVPAAEVVAELAGS